MDGDRRVSLVHDIIEALPQFRAEAEARMVDACTITRGGGAPVFDPNTGMYTTPAGTTVYTGPCEVQISDGLTARQADAGGTDVTLSRLTVKVPISVEGIQIDDTVTITASLLDPDLVDQDYRVEAGFAKTFATARRLQVERLTA